MKHGKRRDFRASSQLPRNALSLFAYQLPGVRRGFSHPTYGPRCTYNFSRSSRSSRLSVPSGDVRYRAQAMLCERVRPLHIFPVSETHVDDDEGGTKAREWKDFTESERHSTPPFLCLALAVASRCSASFFNIPFPLAAAIALHYM